MKALFRIIALILSFVIIFCVFPFSAFADGEGYTYTGESFWGMLLGSGTPDWLDDFVGFISSDYCEDSPTHLHTANSYLRKTNFWEDFVHLGHYDYECQCQYCGDTFFVNEKDVAEVVSNSYDDYVSSLDSTTISSTDSGHVPAFITIHTGSESGPVVASGTNSIDFTPTTTSTYYFSVYAPFLVSESGMYEYYIDFYYLEGFPIHGITSYHGSVLNGSVSLYRFNSCHDEIIGSFAALSRYRARLGPSSSDVNYTRTDYFYSGNSYSYKEIWASSFDADYIGVPFNFTVSFNLSSSDTFSAPSTTRPTHITNAITNYNSENNEYNYFIGKVDNSNNVTNVYNVNIFDEITNEFRDPYTDKPYQVTNWVYDYAKRLYVLTLADDTLLYNGKPIKNLVVWYADDALYYIGLDGGYTDGSDWTDYIVFTDSFQYIIAQKKDDSGTGSDGHKHVFTSETTTPPSCTGTGVRTYSCQFCDYSYDEIIPAAGHQWEVTEVKETQFNDNGDVTAAGYTLYTCAVCAETYKQWSDTGQPGPPTGNTGTGSGGGGSGSGSGSGNSGPSFWDKLKDSVLGLLADLIDAVFSLISDVLSAVLGLVKDLLSFFFGFLSDTVIKGITDLFSAFGSLKLELPEGVASVFGFFSGVILALPAEIKSLFIFGVAALFLVAIFKMVKA